MKNIELFTESIKSITDFRKPQGQRYRLYNLLIIMVLSMLSGCDDFESMALYCQKKANFLVERGLLDGKNFPSHDLFRWIMMNLDKSAFSKILCAWLDAKALLEAIRRHWSIENNLHWSLDIAFNEDKLRLKEKNAALCMAVLRRFSLALIKKSDSKESIKAHRLAMAWNDQDFIKLLNSNNLNFS